VDVFVLLNPVHSASWTATVQQGAPVYHVKLHSQFGMYSLNISGSVGIVRSRTQAMEFLVYWRVANMSSFNYFICS
jgi:hypothetical protein